MKKYENSVPSGGKDQEITETDSKSHPDSKEEKADADGSKAGRSFIGNLGGQLCLQQLISEVPVPGCNRDPSVGFVVLLYRTVNATSMGL